jgi:hypothetical protein
MKSS